MSAVVKLELDHDGIREILTGPDMRRMVDEAAAGMAAHVRATAPDRFDVNVHAYTTDRAAAAVVISGPGAAVWQAEHGVLTRAAVAVGAEVRAR